MPFNLQKGISLRLNDLFLILLANIILTVLICLFIPFIYALIFQGASTNLVPLMIVGVLLFIQLYINSWILTIRSVYSILNVMICLIVILTLWFGIVGWFSQYLV